MAPGSPTEIPTPTRISSTTPPTTSPSSNLNMAAIIGPAIAVTILVIFIAAIIVSVIMLIKCSHFKQTSGELSNAGMKENKEYKVNSQIQYIATATNEAYGCVGNIPVVQNVAYVPAALNIPTVQNEAYSTVSGATVNTDTEEHYEADEMYDYVKN